MADYIHVHCPKCNRGIRAPRAAAGRYGKCPSCHNKVYVPTPDDELEEIPLAPLDEDDHGMQAEARRVEAELLRDKARNEAGDEARARPAGKSPAMHPPATGAEEATSAQITDLIIEYLQAMKNSDLAAAERLARKLSKVKSHARNRIQQLMVDAMPPPGLGDLPSGLYLGFLKKLDESLG